MRLRKKYLIDDMYVYKQSNIYRLALVHEGRLHVHQKPLASVYIKHPVEESQDPCQGMLLENSPRF